MKKIVFIILSSLITLSASAELHIVQKKDKYGYADDSGKVIIKEQFNQVTPFVNGRAKVQKGKNWGYIDEYGKEVIKIEYNLIEDFNDKGIARVKKGNKWGYIYNDGSYMIKPEYTFIGTPNEQGYVWVSKAKSLDGGSIGLFKNNVQILKPQYRYLGFFQKTDSADYSDGHVFTTDDANEMKKNLSTLSLSDVQYIWVDRSYRRGIVDLDGKTVVDFMPYAQGAPSDGMVSIRQYNSKKSTYSYNYISINSKNKKIFKKDLTLGTKDPERCYPFTNGSALIVSNSNGCYLIDKQGNYKSQKYNSSKVIGDNKFIVEKGGLMGLMDNTGNEVIACKYSDLKVPLEGSLLMSAQDADSKKYGVIDASDTTIIPFNYDNVAGVMKNKVYVKNSDGWGVLDMNLNVLITPKWEDVSFAKNENDKIIWAKDSKDSKWHTVSFEKDSPIYDFSFDDVSAFNADGISIVQNGEKFGAVHSSGFIVLPLMLSSWEIASSALIEIKQSNKDRMTDTEAYRFNIYQNPVRHKYRLHQIIENELWDF